MPALWHRGRCYLPGLRGTEHAAGDFTALGTDPLLEGSSPPRTRTLCAWSDAARLAADRAEARRSPIRARRGIGQVWFDVQPDDLSTAGSCATALARRHRTGSLGRVEVTGRRHAAWTSRSTCRGPAGR